MKYQAPKHCTGVFTSAGEMRADADGIIEIADDAPESVHRALRLAECKPLAAEKPLELDRAAPPEAKPKG